MYVFYLDIDKNIVSLIVGIASSDYVRMCFGQNTNWTQTSKGEGSTLLGY